MPVHSLHYDYESAQDAVKTTRDACAGQKAIKRERTRYLPEFYPPDAERYEKYIDRAYYVNVVGRTKSALIGAVFRRPIKANLPPALEYLMDNADGQGQSLEQVAKFACSEILETDRYGFLVDFPTAPDGASLADTRDLKATILGYDFESIINWDTEVINGKETLKLVVLAEEEKIYKDIFSWSKEDRYRVLRLDEQGQYVQEVYTHDGDLLSAIRPLQAGVPMGHIPFYFVGGEDNSTSINTPPLFDLANVNIAHYRNCADYEEGTHLHGQPTLVIDTGDTGATEFEQLNPNGVTVGSRRGIALQHGKAMLLQAEANGAAHEAMVHKEEQMVSIGARLITQRGVNQTAESARIAASSEASVLNSIVGNVSEALEAACEDVAAFMGVDSADVYVKLNRDFFDGSIDANQAMMLIQFADRGDIARSDVRAKLREAGWLEDFRTDEMIDEEAEANPMGLLGDPEDTNAVGITSGYNRATGSVERGE